ncbi:PBS lyase HEAT domain protein repeat-containing protein [Stanieria cyanosphaera PCC 7437]|uniref:PBS lyase HEAT domain protein repeat-containing protein n=1 Tax=Stanieria cyanosphaera (strain ATCC 29371 / PCC 7437) TaxID=111780 RepID=K9XYY2_STAC7|nr:HEAT repeat domain-containing protein [Stanieria cyanosphaera]AFZ37336.1 PBS lyase HEAT domain protein repeat-containing protein [Stanieria cyanosphaera PCC 7437]
MSNPVTQLSETETDALLKKVNQQLNLNSFDVNDHQLIQQMVECMGDPRGLVRLGFAEALGVVGFPAVPFLREALAHHCNPVVRRAAAKTLNLIADPTAIPTLIDAVLNDDDVVVRGSAVGALAQTGEASVPPLIDILASPESTETIKGHAAWALAFIGNKAREQLYQAFNSDSAEVRSAVVGAIAKVAEEQREERALNLLIDSLQDPASSVRSEAAAALGNLAEQSAIPDLLKLLQHSEGESRKAAALALMKIGDPAVLESLQTALERESEAAIQQIIKLAITQLEKKLESDDWN